MNHVDQENMNHFSNIDPNQVNEYKEMDEKMDNQRVHYKSKNVKKEDPRNKKKKMNRKKKTTRSKFQFMC